MGNAVERCNIKEMVLCLKCQYNFLFQSLTASLTVTYMVTCKGKVVKLQGVQQETCIALHQNGPEVTDTSLGVTERWYLKKKKECHVEDYTSIKVLLQVFRFVFPLLPDLSKNPG